MTPLEHSDEILKAQPGEVLMVCQPISVDWDDVSIFYQIGARMRVVATSDECMLCVDEWGEYVTLDRSDMQALDRRPMAMQEGLKMTEKTEWVKRGDFAYEKGIFLLWMQETHPTKEHFDAWLLTIPEQSVVEFPAERCADRSFVLKRADAIIAAISENPA